MNIESYHIWHEILGHVNFNSIKKIIKLNLIPKFSFDSFSRSEIHVQGKNIERSCASITRTFEPLKLIHSYVSFDQSSHHGRIYFVTFIDDYSKFCYTYLLKFKDKVLDWFKVYKAKTENQLDRKIKILRSDRGGSIPQMICQDSAKSMILFRGNCSLHTSIQQCS